MQTLDGAEALDGEEDVVFYAERVGIELVVAVQVDLVLLAEIADQLAVFVLQLILFFVHWRQILQYKDYQR